MFLCDVRAHDVGYASVCAEVSGTSVPARFSAFFSAKFGHAPSRAGAFVAEGPGSAVPARFSAISCTRRDALECLMPRCLVPRCLHISRAIWCVGRCVRELELLRFQVWPCPLVSLKIPCIRRWEYLMLGFRVPRCPLVSPVNLVHPPLCAGASNGEVSGTALPACVSAKSMCTLLDMRAFVA